MASESTIKSVSTLVDGSRWMLFGNSVNGKVYWDPSTLGDGFAYPDVELQYVLFHRPLSPHDVLS